MIIPTIKKEFILPDPCEKEILRYAGVSGRADFDSSLLKECFTECMPLIKPMVCYATFSVKVEKDRVFLDTFSVSSKDLAKNLKRAEKVILFAATIGIEIDRAIQKHNRLSPTKALYFQAIGSERVEALCDVFCGSIENSKEKLPRFSPGYGDLALSVQKDIFRYLQCEKYLGISLNESLIMTPTKSVTAFMGII